jgi:hypothetical protein
MTEEPDFPYSDHNGHWVYHGKVLRSLPKSFRDRFLKKKILVDVTVVDDKGKEIDRKQFWGIITSITARQGIEVRNPNTKITFRLPPALDCLSRPKKTEYKLNPTGEVLEDPDFYTSWSATRPPQGNWGELDI